MAARWGGRRFGIATACGLALLLGAGCDGSGPASGDALAEAAAFRNADTVQAGERLFVMHCATCHGERRQGAERWWERDGEGRFGPPALDGSAHTWHHPVWQLRDMIRHGSAVGRAGTEHQRGFMPSFVETLAADDVDALIAYIVTNWPEPVYDAWLDYQKRDPTQAAWERRTDERWVLQERD